MAGMIGIIRKLGPIGIPFPGNANSAAPLIYVKDVAAAILQAGTEPLASGQTFNLVDGSRHSWRGLLESIAGHLGTKLRIVTLPRLLLHLSALPIDLVSGYFGARLDAISYAGYFSSELYFDSTKARNLLNWRPRCSLEEGIREMTEFYSRKEE